MKNKRIDIDAIISDIKMNYELAKLSKHGTIIRKTPSLEREECNISDYLTFNKYNDIVKEFDNNLNKNFSNKCNQLFYRNIKDLKIKDDKKSIFEFIQDLKRKTNLEGNYSINSNTIRIISVNKKEDKKVKSIIMHELLHVSSRKDTYFHGLCQERKVIDGRRYIGSELNEGYTELLNQRYFTKCVDNNCYHDQIILASCIEKIVGKEKMQECYFQADLYSLVKEIGNYEEDLNKVADLILGIDRLSTYEYQSHYDNKYSELRRQLDDIYKNKLDMQLEYGVITKEEYIKASSNKFISCEEDYNKDLTDIIFEDNKNEEIKIMLNVYTNENEEKVNKVK